MPRETAVNGSPRPLAALLKVSRRRLAVHHACRQMKTMVLSSAASSARRADDGAARIASKMAARQRTLRRAIWIIRILPPLYQA
jgi:hypothetical protein